LEGKVAALFSAQVARSSDAPTSLGITLLVRSDSRIVTVIVLEGAQIIAADGALLATDEIPPAATVLLTGRWTSDETVEATRVVLLP